MARSRRDTSGGGGGSPGDPAALSALREQMQALNEATRAYAQAVAAAFDRTGAGARDATRAQRDLAAATQRTAQMQRDLRAAFLSASGSLTGFVTLGLRGTAQGEQLSLQFQQLNRQIAAVFVPVITLATNRLRDLVGWFRGLTEEQQDQLARWAGLAVGALGVAAVLPRVVGGFQSLGAALSLLSANPLVAAAVALAALLASTEEGRSAFLEMWEALKPIGEAVGEIFAPILDLIKQIAGAVAGVLAPVFKALAAVILVALAPVRWLADLLRTGPARFSTPQGGRQLRELQGEERSDELARRQREINYLRNEASLEEVAQIRGQTGMGTGWARAGTETQRRSIADQMQTELDRQRRAAGGAGARRLDAAGGGMEGITDIFRRVQTAANRTDVAQRTREAQLRQLELVNDNLQGRQAGPRPRAWPGVV